MITKIKNLVCALLNINTMSYNFEQQEKNINDAFYSLLKNKYEDLSHDQAEKLRTMIFMVQIGAEESLKSINKFLEPAPKRNIKDLGERLIKEPYEILIDISDHDYWETGMITKLNGKDVMIIECTQVKKWRKCLDPSAGMNSENRTICKLLISEL